MSVGEITLHAEPVLESAGIRIPTAAHTLAGFRRWANSKEFPERGHFAFLGGGLYIDLTMEEIETHNKVKTEISRVIANLNGELDLGEFYSDGVLLTNLDAEVSNEPDGVFVLWESLEKGRAVSVPREGHDGQYAEIEGSPDWVLEVVSASSVDKDTSVLRSSYHAAGIREYWLVDARREQLSFLILQHDSKEYLETPIEEGGWQYSQVFARHFRLERERGRLGRWKYALIAK
jgi:Uma2 family endonuclease